MKLPAVALTLAAICFAQSPAFEVASVKVNHSGSGGSNFPGLRNGTLRAENATLRMILQVAYGLSALQITGPGWIDSDRYDLSAKSPQGVPDTDLRPMLQALLKERFQVAAHVETKEMPVYDLVVAKGGLKIAPFDREHPLQPPPRNGAASMMIGSFTMTELAKQLAGPAGRPVIDKTALSGQYACVLLFSPLSVQMTTGAQPDSGSNSGTDIFGALEQQAGLKLESSKAPIEILVVDHAERAPTEN